MYVNIFQIITNIFYISTAVYRIIYYWNSLKRFRYFKFCEV